MNTYIETTHCVVCPWCNGQSHHGINHLYQTMPTSFGPWHCGECGKAFRGSVQGIGNVKVERDPDACVFKPTFALLKLNAKDGPVFFVIQNQTPFQKDDTDEELQSHSSYYFEEHSCPTNWLRYCLAVIKGKDQDPHGFLEFVRAIEQPVDYSDQSDTDWKTLFPEAFQ